MSAEPKVLLEWKEPVVTGRIMSDRTVHMAFDDGTSWKLCDDDSVSVLAIYDALEARHARVREAAEAARKMIVALCLETNDVDRRHELQQVERVIYEALNGKVRTAGSDFLETP